MIRNSVDGDFRQKNSLDSMLAKTYENGGSMNILTHSVLTGLVARELLARLSLPLKHNPLFQFHPEIALLAAIHDIGKISSIFQAKLRGNKDYDSYDRSHWGYHAGVSRLFAKHYFREKYRKEKSSQAKFQKKFIPDIIGRHHGWEVGQSDAYSLMDNLFGGDSFQEVRMELLILLQKLFGEDWITVENRQQGWVVSGVVSVADWIASSIVCENLELNNGTPVNAEIEKSNQIVEAKLNAIGFTNYSVIEGLSFSDVFDGFSPNKMQEKVIEKIKEPGVYIIETEMGQGKTEAALYGAYQLLVSQQARGIYFALPTRLTSQKIYTRFDAFIDKILKPSTRVGSKLIHSSSQFHNFGSPEITEISEDGSLEHRWFLNKRRALIAPFGVGTIDQALMSVLYTKFWFVRAFALAGKVIILDEVHSYDLYTGTIMEVMIKTLLQLGCTVIILSATLTSSRGKSLLQENEAGQKTDKPSPYPSFSAKSASSYYPEICPVDGAEPKKVILERLRNDAEGREEAMEIALKAADEGQQVLWIENTVASAQGSFTTLAARGNCIPGMRVGLLHSRFIPGDREKREQEWIALYGKNTPPQRSGNGNILVGTQVLEQSLDIDADLLITAIAPTDMLLQRLGRLWRHNIHQPLRPDAAQRRCIILSPSREDIFDADVEKAFGSAGRVYSPYVLARTFLEWEGRKSISLPGEIREILENTYAPLESEEPELLVAKKNLEKEKSKLKSLAKLATSSNSSKLSEQNASTRFSELATRDVILMKKFSLQSHEILIKFMDNSHITLTKKEVSITNKKKKSNALMLNLLPVPTYLAPEGAVLSSECKAILSEYIYMGKDASVLLACVDDAGQIHWEGDGDLNEKYWLYYRDNTGYYAEKKEDI